jgi:putative copper export protein
VDDPYQAAVLVVHLLAASVWVGGTVVLVFAGVPAIRVLEGGERARALRALGERWRPLGWSALGVLVTTGLILVFGHADEVEGSFAAVLGTKLALFTGLVAVVYVNEFVLGPALARQVASGEAPTLRPRLVVFGWVSFALTLTVPVLGAILVELGRT